jgi:hypothetical protein
MDTMTRTTVIGVVLVAAAVVAASTLGGRRPAAGDRPGALAGAVTPTAVFDGRGRLWVAWVAGEHILVSTSVDFGRTFAPPVQITPVAEPIDANGEARPKIAIGTDGEVFVSWTRRGATPYTGDIRFAVSRDGGRTYAAPVTINDDGLDTAHRFDSLHVNRAGHVYIVWIDKRDLEAASGDGLPYHGAALYYAVSTDGGRTFSPNRKIKDHVCECCRLAIDIDGRDQPVLVWRDVIDGRMRDHAIVRFDGGRVVETPRRATNDGWDIDACPHHGPALSISDDGTYHMVWFTGAGPDGAGSFYARSTDGGLTFRNRMRIAPPDTIGHAVVRSVGARVVVAWKAASAAGGKPVQVIESNDGGTTWTPPRVVAVAAEGSDHPFLLRSGERIFLSWFSAAEGYRLFAIP